MKDEKLKEDGIRMMDRIYCNQCTMTFRRGYRPRGSKHRCPDCKRPFWAVWPRGHASVICGISDLQAVEWGEETPDEKAPPA